MRSPAGRRSVLLLDSCPLSREVNIGALEAEELDVTTASDDEAAFAIACELVPELAVVIFDHRTRADRFALCEQLKGDVRTRSLSVLLGSPDLDEADIHRATELGVLAMALTHGHATKLSAAVRGILSVEEPSSG
jgi:DNA-binding NarL/FixJ family response regulator